MTITSHDMISKHYLQLNISSGNQPCGSIDFISEKINFNITGPSFFKGMVAIKDIELEYKDGRLIFLFQNKKNLLFNCSIKEFEKVSTHINSYGYRKTKNIGYEFYNHISLNLSGWNGNDVFRTPQLRHIFCTENFKIAVEHTPDSHLIFVPILID